MNTGDASRTTKWVNQYVVFQNTLDRQSSNGSKHSTSGTPRNDTRPQAPPSPSPQKGHPSTGGSPGGHCIKSNSRSLRSSSLYSQKDRPGQGGDSDRHNTSSSSTVRDNSRALVLSRPYAQQDSQAPFPARTNPWQQDSSQGLIMSGSTPSHNYSIPVVPMLPPPHLGSFSDITGAGPHHHDSTLLVTPRQDTSLHSSTVPPYRDSGSLVVPIPSPCHSSSTPEVHEITYTLTQLKIVFTEPRKSRRKGRSSIH